MDINTEEIKKKLLEKTESVKKTVEEKAGRTLPWTKIAAALVGVVLVVGVAAGVGGKKESSKSAETKTESSKSASQEKKQTLSPKKVPEYLTVSDRKSGTWVTGYNASIIPENLVIPDGIVGIDNAFSGCELLESVKIPGSVKSIGRWAFSGCTSLASVTLAKGLEEINDAAFSGCTALKSITIPEGVVYIGIEAFEGCTALASITIPEGGVKIRENAFENCTSLASVTIAKDVSEIGYVAFKGCTSLKEVRYKNTVKRFKLIAALGNYSSFEKGVVIHCTDGDYVIGSDAE